MISYPGHAAFELNKKTINLDFHSSYCFSFWYAQFGFPSGSFAIHLNRDGVPKPLEIFGMSAYYPDNAGRAKRGKSLP